jgi:hypothetical protein
MGRGRSVVGGQLIPFPAVASDKQTGAQVVPTAPAAPAILGTVQIPGGDVDKLIHFTCQLSTAAAVENVTFHLYRGAAEISATDVYVDAVQVANGSEVIHCHWHDATPGAGQVTYTVRVDGDIGGATTVTSRRLTVEHAG